MPSTNAQSVKCKGKKSGCRGPTTLIFSKPLPNALHMRKQISGGYHTCHYRVLVVPCLTVEKSGFMIKTLDPCYEVPGKKHLYISISIYPPSLTRCPNHLSWIHLTSKRSSSAPSSHQIAELLTLMLTIATIYSFSHLDLVTIDEGFNRHGFTSKALPFGSALFLR